MPAKRSSRSVQLKTVAVGVVVIVVVVVVVVAVVVDQTGRVARVAFEWASTSRGPYQASLLNRKVGWPHFEPCATFAEPFWIRQVPIPGPSLCLRHCHTGKAVGFPTYRAVERATL